MAHTEDDLRLRRMSKTAFGQELRLAVMLAIKDWNGEPFCLTDVAKSVGVRSPSSIQDPLQALLSMGVIKATSGPLADRRKWYVSNRSAAWQLAEELEARALRADDRSNS